MAKNKHCRWKISVTVLGLFRHRVNKHFPHAKKEIANIIKYNHGFVNIFPGVKRKVLCVLGKVSPKPKDSGMK